MLKRVVTSSDIIKEIILSRGYKSLYDFAKNNNLNYSNLNSYYVQNRWGEYYLNRLGKKLGVNLLRFATEKTSEKDDIDNL